MTTDELEARLKLIARCAPDLRKAGVTGKVAIGEVQFELAPFEPDPAPQDKTTTTGKPDDPLRDPDTFGGYVPRRRGEPDPSDEDEDPWPSPIDGGKHLRAKPTS